MVERCVELGLLCAGPPADAYSAEQLVPLPVRALRHLALAPTGVLRLEVGLRVRLANVGESDLHRHLASRGGRRVEADVRARLETRGARWNRGPGRGDDGFL